MSPRKATLRSLRTEQQNLASSGLDTLSALEIARVINQEDKKVAAAVERALPQIAQAIDAIADAIRGGGRLIYVGAGTSGRLAALDAAECPPTFNTDPRTVQYVIAGGDKALGHAAEYSEDSISSGRKDMATRKPSKKDVVVGVAASGRTPYTIGALERARKNGAKTVAVVCNRGSEMGTLVDIEIVIDVGPEAVSGSTRMKAGSAQKMALNLLTTGAMARLGYIYGNLMVNVHTRNHKLMERGLNVLEKAAGVDRPTASKTLRSAHNQIAIALIMLKTGLGRVEAGKRLKSVKGNVRQAIAQGRLK
ncbi:MAG TPA: N-acetylmuramic acid 6-phosphate etherase [Candidatus Dormibacteraeota bacterium]|nr:N-acetylmuramic acid 6-phosphate etherase [Candidatus Dormibacteraeota bacterium]